MNVLYEYSISESISISPYPLDQCLWFFFLLLVANSFYQHCLANDAVSVCSIYMSHHIYILQSKTSRFNFDASDRVFQTLLDLVNGTYHTRAERQHLAATLVVVVSQVL